jgi:glycosyltransferase involved in cell wall biosynthesis
MDAQMPGMIRTAFTLPDRTRWTGGYQYFVNLFRVLHRHGAGKVRPVVFVGEDVAAADLAPISDGMADVVRSPDFSASSGGLRLASALFTGSDGQAARIYRNHGIQVVFESARYHGWRFPLPTIAWLPDFQHRRLPGIFSVGDWLRREIGFRAQIASARAIMLSSVSSRVECGKYYPGSSERSRVVPFAAELPPEAQSLSIAEVTRKYDLPVEFFYLPNQFWMHKNHQVIIDALKVLQGRGVGAAVAASGTLADYRHPELLQRLESRVAELGLGRQFRFLGLIPREDVYALMRGAVAVVNPSLSEGWSTNVEEARSLGVPMVLSDIAVHREQAAGCAVFFDPHSPAAAADALQHALSAPRVSLDEASRERRTLENEDRLGRYARNFESLIEEVVS